MSIIDMDLLPNVPIHVIGAGGIGSMTTLLLAKMGAQNITVYDFDDLEDHNISNQTYHFDDVGKPKVEALRDLIHAMEGFEINIHNEKFTGEEEDLSGIVVIGVDNMAARKEIYENLSVNFSQRVDLLIDARMGAQTMEIIPLSFLSEDSRSKYEGRLFSDQEAMDLPCTERAIIYNTAGIGAMIGNMVRKHLAGELSVTTHYIFDYQTMSLLQV